MKGIILLSLLSIGVICSAQDKVEIYDYTKIKTFNQALKKYEIASLKRTVVLNYSTGFILVRGNHDLGESYKVVGTDSDKEKGIWTAYVIHQKTNAKCNLKIFKDLKDNHFICECGGKVNYELIEPIK
jgi:hypothetical protein